MHKTNASSSLSPLLTVLVLFLAKRLTIFLYRVYTSSFSFFLGHFYCTGKLCIGHLRASDFNAHLQKSIQKTFVSVVVLKVCIKCNVD